MSKQADTDHPVHDLIARRWSPYGFSDEAVDTATLHSLFEAARWAPSSYNEQPWRYIVATRDDPEAFERLLSCLAEPNQAWAGAAPVLALGVVSHNFESNGKFNRAAVHDLGLASAHLTVEATARGLYVHQMIGIDPERAREVYQIPDGFEAWTALAIGQRADTAEMSDNLAERDSKPRARKSLDQFVFCDRFGETASLAES